MKTITIALSALLFPADQLLKISVGIIWMAIYLAIVAICLFAIFRYFYLKLKK